MLKKHYKELWETRFRKILDSEQEAIAFYRRLLKENEGLLSITKIKVLLKEILRDEAKHARIARELINIVSEKVVSESKEIDKKREMKIELEQPKGPKVKKVSDQRTEVDNERIFLLQRWSGALLRKIMQSRQYNASDDTDCAR